MTISYEELLKQHQILIEQHQILQQQYQTLFQQHQAALREIQVLKAEIVDLKEKLNTNSSNSSKAPSQDPLFAHIANLMLSRQKSSGQK